MSTGGLANTIRAYYRAYEAKDRNALEELLTPDFRFSSPLDDRIDRATYFLRCWPNCERIRSFDLKRIHEQEGVAFVEYDLHPNTDVGPIRNVELFFGGGNRVREVVAFFGRQRGTVGDNG
jgi:ketosteroid isomerase-like protein